MQKSKYEEDEKTAALAAACTALSNGDNLAAASLIKERYPFAPFDKASRGTSQERAMRIYVRDGFADRYSGRRLIFQGSLRLMSKLLPVEFPFHPNWKTSECHFAYWEYAPTLDHIVPISRGGKDDEDNMATTSAVMNAAKANFTLYELGWELKPVGDFREWDGLVSWFLHMSAITPAAFKEEYFRRWLAILEAMRRRGEL